MGSIAKATLGAAIGLALLSVEAIAQTRYPAAPSPFGNGAPSDYHTYRAPKFEQTEQPTQQRQAAPQRPAQQPAPYNNSWGIRPR